LILLLIIDFSPWDGKYKIPWDDQEFSERMLREHLSQEHDMASRRSANIEHLAAWINQTILSNRPSRILDLGCGPGLYEKYLCDFGHECTGIDFSPASIK
jgi:SAM-dependent methyltransferase